MLIARYGHRDTLRSDVFLNYHVHGMPDGPIGMDYFVWVIRNQHRTLLVDTGFSRHGGDIRSRRTLVELPDLYRRLGVDTSQVPTVILTHAHYDHIGNIGLFPGSTLLMSRNEYQFWTGPHAKRTLFHHSVEDEELDALRVAVADGRVSLFAHDAAPAPGVEVIELGGHTPGQSVVKVNTQEGVVVLASDAVHYYEELDKDLPFSTVANLADMYAGFDEIRRWVTNGEVQHVVSGHDPETLRRFPAAPGSLGEFVSIIGSSERPVSR